MSETKKQDEKIIDSLFSECSISNKRIKEMEDILKNQGLEIIKDDTPLNSNIKKYLEMKEKEEIIESLVSKEALEQLDVLNVKLVEAYVNAERLFMKSQELCEYHKQGVTVLPSGTVFRNFDGRPNRSVTVETETKKWSIETAMRLKSQPHEIDIHCIISIADCLCKWVGKGKNGADRKGRMYCAEIFASYYFVCLPAHISDLLDNIYNYVFGLNDDSMIDRT